MKKRVEVSSVDSRVFVKEILALGKQGAILPDDAGVFKGLMLRTQVEVDDNILVKESQNVRVLPADKGRIKDNVKAEVKKQAGRKPAAKKEELKEEVDNSVAKESSTE